MENRKNPFFYWLHENINHFIKTYFDYSGPDVMAADVLSCQTN